MPEMIAMLNGLPRPASQMLPSNVNPYFDAYRYPLNGLGAAIVPASGLNEDDLKAYLASEHHEVFVHTRWRPLIESRAIASYAVASPSGAAGA